MPGFEPGASYMRSKRSTAELHPRMMHFESLNDIMLLGTFMEKAIPKTECDLEHI